MDDNSGDDSGDDSREDGGWPRGEVFPCPHCGQSLYRVDGSPVADGYHLYCDRCANSVNAGFSDAVTLAIEAEFSRQSEPGAGGERERARLRMIETRLRPCSCGGAYRHDSPRRCPSCLNVVIAEGAGVDLWPGYFWTADDDDPTDEEAERVGDYLDSHVRERDIWRDS